MATVVLAAAVAASGCTDPGSGGSAPEGGETGAAVSWEACPSTVSGAAMECGIFRVAEDPASEATRTVSLPVVRFRGRVRGADPTVFLTGGPGESALAYLTELGAPPRVWDTGDLVVVEQRGNPAAEPALVCPQASGLEDAAGLAACRDELVRGGVGLEHYDTAATVEDLHRLLAALGYQRWNVYAVSYGTRVALEYLRRYPGDVGRAVLDSPYPPDVDNAAQAPAATLDQLGALIDACREQPSCAARADVDRADVEAVVQALNLTPAQTPDGTVSGKDLAARLFGALAETSLLPVIPDAIAAARDGDVEAALGLLSIPGREVPAGFAAESFAIGLQLSVLCRDEVPFDSDAATPITTADRWSEPVLSSARLLHQLTQRACRIWSVPPSDPVQADPVTSDADVLVLVGEFDPVTPPTYASIAARGLPNSHTVVVPAVSHYTTETGCGRDRAYRFLASGAAPSPCPPADPWS